MTGLLFLLSIVAFFVICHWLLTNDDPGIEAKTKGLLALKGDVKTASAEEETLKGPPLETKAADAPQSWKARKEAFKAARKARKSN